MILELIQNVSLLIALAVGLQLLTRRITHPSACQVAAGLLFGLVGICGMLMPLHFAPGIFYDARTVIMSIAGLFGGPLVAGIGTLITCIYRIQLGGTGTVPGVLSIIEAAALGVGLYYLRRRSEKWVSWPRLWLFGLVVHILMLLVQLLLPGNKGWEALRQVGPSVIAFYPLAFLLTAWVFLEFQRRSEAEKQLMLSLATQKAMIACSPLALYSIDMDGRVLTWNESAERLFGWSETDVVGKPLPIVPPEYEEEFAELRQRVGQGESFTGMELVRRRKDGTEFSARLAVAPMLDESGRVLGIFAAMEDITQHQQVREAARREHERLEFVIDGGRLGTWSWNVQTNEISVNDTWTEMLGYRRGEYGPMQLKDWERLTHPEDLARAWERLKLCIEGQTPHYDAEIRMRHKDGHWVWILDRGRIMTRDAAGRPLEMYGTHADITSLKEAEEQSRRQIGVITSLLDSIPDIVFYKDMNGVYLGSNAEFARFAGVPEGAIVGKTDYDLFEWQRAENLQANDRQIIEAQITLHNEEWVNYPDGRRVLLDTIKTPLRDANGQVIGILGISRDITDRKLAEEALIQSEQKHRTYIKNAPEGLFVVDDQSRYVEVNDAACHMTGYSRDELLTMRVADLESPNAPPETLNSYQQLRETGEVNTQIMIRTRQGQDRYLLLRAVALGGDRYMAFCSDVTERVMAEQALRDSESRLSLALSVAGMAYWRMDCRTQEVMWAHDHEKLFGIPKNEFKGTLDAVRECVHPDDWPDIIDTQRHAIQEDAPIDNTYRVVHPDGSIHWMHSYGHVYRDRDGQASHIFGVTQDITQRKESELERDKLYNQLAQAQKMESVGRLAGGVAHDFNNMLSIILGYVEIVLGDLPADNPNRASLVEIQKAAQRSAELTRQLLAFARKQTVSPKLLDLDAAIETSLNLLRRLIGEDIELKWYPTGQSQIVRMDPAQVDQMLANLIVNARDSISGTGTVAIETDAVDVDESYSGDREGPPPGQYAKLTISDTGCGMNDETIARIFEPFYTTKEVGEGTGLGLAMVYGIVKQNHGFIHVDSEPDVGTTFQIYLPLAATEEEATDDEQSAPQEPGYGYETILLVEDEPAILSLSSKILRRLGYEVLAAETPDKAIHLADNHKDIIHLLMTDVIMPEMNGKDLADRLRQSRPDLKILFMSGYTANTIAQHGVLDKGMNFIEKPFNRDRLARIVRQSIDSGNGSAS